MLRRLPALALAALVLLAAPTAIAQERALPANFTLLSFGDLPGWSDDDHAAALRAYHRGCKPTALLCREAAQALGRKGTAPRAFLEARFDPVEIQDPGFLTGYFEPEVQGSLNPTPAHPTPLLAPPLGLALKPVTTPAGWPEGMAAARRTATGFAAMPDRGEIETGGLGREARALVYVDPVDAFMIHVQGSARIRLDGGEVIRVGFAGRNGHPYTAIGKVLAEREGLPPAEVTADKLWAWLRAHPDKAPALMRENRSYIFFRRLAARADEGPTGAAGVPLTAGRSLAIDRTKWPFGALVWLDGTLPRPGGGSEPLRRLVVGQDTGTAIVGRTRGDLFVGSGPEAGATAALLRHPVRWIVLRPKPDPAARRLR